MAGVSITYDPSRGGYRVTSRGPVAGYDLARAHLVQVTGSVTDMVYNFPYSPVEVNYENVSAEYEEIQRPSDYSFVARRAPQLTRVSFEFRVAHRPSHGEANILHDLNVLRLMASADVPVILVGVGDFLFNSDSYDRVKITGMRGQALFRIMEMGITVVRREPLSNYPTQADCSVTLIEDRNPVFNVVQLQRLEYDTEPVQQTQNTPSSGNRSSGSGSGNNRPRTPSPTTNNRPRDNYTDVRTSPNTNDKGVPVGGRGSAR